MPELLHPGVYVLETSSGVRPIEGVSTSTAAFIGVTDKGPVPGTILPNKRMAQPVLYEFHRIPSTVRWISQ
jgi:phage tail sheath protein FI